MSNNKRSPKNSKIVSLFITFAILFIVVFTLGVIIGKGLGGSDSATEKAYDLEAPKMEYGVPQMDDEEAGVSEFETEEVILDDEVEPVEDKEPEKSADGTQTEQVDSTQASSATKTPEIEKTPETKETVEEKETAEIIIEATAPPVNESPKESGAMPKIDPNGRYTVQIGAFQNQAEANKLVSSLKSSGYPAFIKQVQTPDKKVWYRVRVGTFSTRSEAVSYGDKLKQSETKVKSVFITTNN